MYYTVNGGDLTCAFEIHGDIRARLGDSHLKPKKGVMQRDAITLYNALDLCDASWIKIENLGQTVGHITQCVVVIL